MSGYGGRPLDAFGQYSPSGTSNMAAEAFNSMERLTYQAESNIISPASVLSPPVLGYYDQYRSSSTSSDEETPMDHDEYMRYARQERRDRIKRSSDASSAENESSSNNMSCQSSAKAFTEMTAADVFKMVQSPNSLPLPVVSARGQQLSLPTSSKLSEKSKVGFEKSMVMGSQWKVKSNSDAVKSKSSETKKKYSFFSNRLEESEKSCDVSNRENPTNRFDCSTLPALRNKIRKKKSDKNTPPLKGTEAIKNALSVFKTKGRKKKGTEDVTESKEQTEQPDKVKQKSSSKTTKTGKRKLKVSSRIRAGVKKDCAEMETDETKGNIFDLLGKGRDLEEAAAVGGPPQLVRVQDLVCQRPPICAPELSDAESTGSGPPTLLRFDEPPALEPATLISPEKRNGSSVPVTPEIQAEKDGTADEMQENKEVVISEKDQSLKSSSKIKPKEKKGKDNDKSQIPAVDTKKFYRKSRRLEKANKAIDSSDRDLQTTSKDMPPLETEVSNGIQEIHLSVPSPKKRQSEEVQEKEKLDEKPEAGKKLKLDEEIEAVKEAPCKSIEEIHKADEAQEGNDAQDEDSMVGDSVKSVVSEESTCIPKVKAVKPKPKKKKVKRKAESSDEKEDLSSTVLKRTAELLKKKPVKEKPVSTGPFVTIHGTIDEPDKVTITNRYDEEVRRGGRVKDTAYEIANVRDLAPGKPFCTFCGQELGLPHFGPYIIQIRLSPDQPLVRAELWVHEDCAVWTSGLYISTLGLQGLEEAVETGRKASCGICQRFGATLSCMMKGCGLNYHYPCSVKAGCLHDEENFTLLCPKHKNRRIRLMEPSAIEQQKESAKAL